MNTPNHPSIPPLEHVTCSVCQKEIPPDTALTPQVAEYVVYFCGLECYEEFVAQYKPNPLEKPGK